MLLHCLIQGGIKMKWAQDDDDWDDNEDNEDDDWE